MSGKFEILLLLIAAAATCWAQPTIGKVDPPFVNGGVALRSFGMNIDGNGFVPGSRAYWNSVPLDTGFVSATRVTANVPASLAAPPGTAALQIGNPSGPTVIYSNIVSYIVASDVFSIHRVLPQALSAGDPASALTVYGFVLPSDSVVLWNDTPLATTFVSQGQVNATVPAGLIATVGSATIRVVSKGISSNFGSVAVQSSDLTFSYYQNTAAIQGGDVSYQFPFRKPGAVPTNGTITFTLAVPVGLIATYLSGTNWTCQQPAGPCTYSLPIAGVAHGDELTFFARVTSNAGSPLALNTTVSGGGSPTVSGSIPVFVYTASSVVQVSSLSPAVSTGANQSFNFQFVAGAQAINVVDVLINTALDARKACYVAYLPGANDVKLVNDNGDAAGPFQDLPLTGSGSISNSQCTIYGVGSFASSSGGILSLTLNIGFKTSFAGNKIIYVAGVEAVASTGWQTMGAYGVPPLPTTFPNAAGMSPSSGSGSNTVLSYSFQDAGNTSTLQTAWALINTAIDGRGACYVAYYRPGNQVFLYPDNGDGTQATSIVLSGTNSLSNSQCTISAAGSSVTANGNQLTVNLNTTFKSGFTGPKGVWTAVQTFGGVSSAWTPAGVWRVPQ